MLTEEVKTRMAKRINVLARYRLAKVVSELKEIQKDSKLNKIDTWNLDKATEMIEQILSVPIKGDPKDDVLSTVSEEGPS